MKIKKIKTQMSGLLLNFISGVSTYYFSWIMSSLFVYISILTFFSIKISILDKNHSHITQDLFGMVGSFIFCVLLALIQGMFIGTVLYFIANITEIGLIKKSLYNALLPMFLIGYYYFGNKIGEKEKLKSDEN